MNISKYAYCSILLMCLFFKSTAQNEVRIKVQGESDLIYNGKSLQILNQNLSIGESAGASLGSTALSNTLIGKESGKSISTGRANTFLGERAGYNNNGAGNVFIGIEAGLNENGDDKLFISNSSTSSPLIFGDFRGKFITINDYLNVTKDLDVTGSGEMSALTLFSGNPVLNFKSGSTIPFSMQYNSTLNNLSISELGVTGDVLSIKNGEITLPQYAGTGDEAVHVDPSGKLIRKPKANQTFNTYNFFDPVQFSGAIRYRLGVQLPDGITIAGLNAYVLDNEPGTNTGIANTPYLSLERESKTDKSAGSEEIFRVEGVNTATDVFTSITTTNDIGTDRDIIDNANFIYYLEVFMCPNCDFREITILE
jgi:hypothetical protein